MPPIVPVAVISSILSTASAGPVFGASTALPPEPLTLPVTLPVTSPVKLPCKSNAGLAVCVTSFSN